MPTEFTHSSTGKDDTKAMTDANDGHEKPVDITDKLYKS